jgi:hypothetical protein
MAVPEAWAWTTSLLRTDQRSWPSVRPDGCAGIIFNDSSKISQFTNWFYGGGGFGCRLVSKDLTADGKLISSTIHAKSIFSSNRESVSVTSGGMSRWKDICRLRGLKSCITDRSRWEQPFMFSSDFRTRSTTTTASTKSRRSSRTASHRRRQTRSAARKCRALYNLRPLGYRERRKDNEH